MASSQIDSVADGSSAAERSNGNQAGPSSSSAGSVSMVKYGELVILGYNGGLPQGDRGRRRSKFALYRRQKANGIARSKNYKVKVAESAQAVMNNQVHSISYTLNRSQAMIVEYAKDENTDLFQIGRSSESPIDFVVMDTVPGNTVQEAVNSQSTISRFACRILSSRDPESRTCKIFAAGFNSARNIFLGEKATKWEKGENEVDGLTTNGVLIMHTKGDFFPLPEPEEEEKEENDAPMETNNSQQNKIKKSKMETKGPPKAGLWREISVGGEVFGLRESRSAALAGSHVEHENNELRDGTLIDLCGATLLWRSAKSLEHSPTQKMVDAVVEQLNAGRPQCPVGLHTLQIPNRKSSNQVSPDQQMIVYLSCGHVQGRHDWGDLHDSRGSRQCPICMGMGETAILTMGAEPTVYVDHPAAEYCFVPCGHMASEKTVKYWAYVPMPCGTSGFQGACPFCATPLTGSPGFTKLIFQDLED